MLARVQIQAPLGGKDRAINGYFLFYDGLGTSSPEKYWCHQCQLAQGVLLYELMVSLNFRLLNLVQSMILSQ